MEMSPKGGERTIGTDTICIILICSNVNDGEMLLANVSSSEDIADLSIEENAGFAVHVEWAEWLYNV